MSHHILQHWTNSFVYADATFKPPLDFYSNREIKDRVPAGTQIELALTKQVKKLKSDFFPINIGFAASAKLVEAIKDLVGSDVSFHKCYIKYSNGKAVDEDYYFVEILKWSDCFDFENSIYDKDHLLELPDQSAVRICKKFCVRESELAGVNFAFVRRVTFSDPIISEQVKNAIEKIRPQAVRMIATAEFTWNI